MSITSLLQVAVFCILLGYMLGMIPELPKDKVRKYFGGTGDSNNTGDDRNPRMLLIVLVSIIALIFARDVLIGTTPLGNTAIGGFFEKREYVEEYYVFAFPERTGAMSYKVKAEIRAYAVNRGFGLSRMYEVNRIFMPDGGTVSFTEKTGSGYSLRPDRMIAITDDNGRHWRIQLTREKAQ